MCQRKPVVVPRLIAIKYSERAPFPVSGWFHLFSPSYLAYLSLMLAVEHHFTSCASHNELIVGYLYCKAVGAPCILQVAYLHT